MSADSVYVIAEAGVNHNGSRELAFALVEAAADAGANAVKFQTFVPEALVSRHAAKAEYQKRATEGAESQLEMLRRLALKESDFYTLRDHCAKHGIEFLSSPFDSDSAAMLIRMGLPTLKLGSGELTSAPLLLQIARSGSKLILSTGMSTLDEVEDALGVLAFGYLGIQTPPSLEAFRQAYRHPLSRASLLEKVTLLHCTTEYPAPFEDVHLRAMETLRSHFGLTTGFSDHTIGYSVATAAVALGARLVEKHFTLNRNLPGPDHKASLEPHDLKAMVKAIREVELALGRPEKAPAGSEVKNIAVARKSVVASRPIAPGEIFTEQNLGTKRAGTGISAMQYYDLLGMHAPSNFEEDEIIVL